MKYHFESCQELSPVNHRQDYLFQNRNTVIKCKEGACPKKSVGFIQLNPFGRAGERSDKKATGIVEMVSRAW